MTSPETKLHATIAGLMQLLLREDSALRMRVYERIKRLADEKEKLLGAMNLAALDGFAPALATRLAGELETLREKAANNAAALQAASQGFADARRRLETLAAESRKSGLYAAHGASVAHPVSVSVARNA